MAEKDTLADAKEAFEEAREAENDNRSAMLEDVKFVRLGQQWPESVKREREADGRPALTINKLPAFVRQVVNDARMNRPQITVTGVDSQSDPKTAEVLSGIIRHIERNSSADVAYDTAIEWAVTGGVGYFTIGTEYASDTGFEQELRINRVVSPFAIYGDPNGESSDGSDWKTAFHIVTGDGDELTKKYGKKSVTSWDDGGTGDKTDDDDIRLARWWCVEQQKKTLVLLSNGGAITEDELTADFVALLSASGITPEDKTREISVPKVVMYLLSGNGVLEETDWAGRYIPLVPVYGEDFWVEDKRYWKSLVRDALDAQRAFNYWRTAATELVALQPKAPWIGPKGAFKTDAKKWASANVKNHAFIEYDNEVPPQRQPFAGLPAGALQEALNAGDDIKAITGMYDASLGARSNETSGRAIMARQREGDISSFHFTDNLTRSIRQAGRILVDLIPFVYDTPRMMRIVGKDDTTEMVQINQPYQAQDDNGQAIIALHDVTVGRYDVSVTAGPSFTTQRQEAAAQMTELIRAFPDAAPVIGDLVAKNLDWPGADEIAKRLEKLVPGYVPQGQDPAQMLQQSQMMAAQMQQGQQAIEQGKQEIEQGKAELQKLLSDLKIAQANLKAQEAQFQAEVAQKSAELQQREMAVEVKGLATDARGQQLEANAQQNGSNAAAQIVQDALNMVTQRIAGIEQAMSRQQQPIIVPVGGGRRMSRMKRGPNGDITVMTEDMADDGIGQA